MTKYDPKAAQQHAQNFLTATFLGENAQRRGAEMDPRKDPQFMEQFGSDQEIEEWTKWWTVAYYSEQKRSSNK